MEISKHAETRYAERIMSMEKKADVAVFIQNHREKIKNDIEKMVEFGLLLYTGKSVSEYNKNVVDVYLRDTWVVIVDREKQLVVTLYSIDLGVGKEFNDEYITLMKNKLDKAKAEYESKKMTIVKKQVEYKNVMEQNKQIIAEYKKTIKALEEQNQMYDDLIDSMQANMQVAEKDVRDIVAVFVGRKVF